MDSFHSFYSAVRRITRPMILRKIEMLFYFFFIVLCFIGFLLPLATDVNRAASYTVAILSLIYAIVLYRFRLAIKVAFGLVFHTAALLLFSSFIIFDFGLLEIGGAFVAVAVLCLSGVVILCGLGHRVFANTVNEPPINEGWPEAVYPANAEEQVELDVLPDPWRFNDGANLPEMPNNVNDEVVNNDVVNPEIPENNNGSREILND